LRWRYDALMIDRIKIGFDAKRYFHNQTGLGNYARWLIDGFIEKSEYDCHLFTPKKQPVFDHRKATLITPSTFLNQLFPSLWRSMHVSKELPQHQLQIYHGTSNEIPYGIHKLSHLKTVVTIHDVINLVYPKNYKKVDRFVYRQKLEYATKNADAIVTVSEATKNDLLSFFTMDENKIKVIGLSRKLLTDVADESMVFREPYILCVSSFGKRKNLAKLITAHSELTDVPKLVIAGGKGDDELAILEASSNNPNCEMVRNPTDAQLSALYKNSLFVVYPSLYEGFGIPILEAFQFQKVVATSNISSMPEVGGEAALYFNPNDSDSIKEAILNLLSADVRKKYKTHIPSQLEKFNSKYLLNKYAEMYRSLL